MTGRFAHALVTQAFQEKESNRNIVNISSTASPFPIDGVWESKSGKEYEKGTSRRLRIGTRRDYDAANSRRAVVPYPSLLSKLTRQP